MRRQIQFMLILLCVFIAAAGVAWFFFYTNSSEILFHDIDFFFR